jgi:SPP1 family phage portal protein
VVLVYDDTIEEELLYAIRYYKCTDILTDTDYYMVEVYSRTEVITYKSNENISNLTEQSRVPHYYGLVPVSVFYNNEEEIGDFEPVISLIDAYDQMESDSLNDFEYFVDAYLALTGLQADSDDIAAMKENRVILLDEDSDAKWLIKDTNDSNIENVKNRIDMDIHKFSKVPNLSDESFSGNASGVAIKYKTMPMENIVSIKERKFKKGLQRRIELLFNILSLKGGSNYDWRAINITFTRNLPTNESEVATMVSTLDGIVSDETLLAQIPFVENVQDEIERLKEQKQEAVDAFYNQDFTSGNEDEDVKEDENE